MNVAFIQCPAWITDNPPYAPALIGAALKAAGHQVKCFDLNIGFYNHCTSGTLHETIINGSSWSNFKMEADWEDEEKVNDFFYVNIEKINSYLSDILEDHPEAVCFSVQKTSVLFSYRLTCMIKEKQPGTIIIWGGPYCFKNYHADEITDRRKEVDIVCIGDGETSLPALLQKIESKDDSYRDTHGYAFQVPDGPAIKKLYSKGY